MKRLLALLLILAALASLGIVIPGSAATYTASPFYMVNWMGSVNDVPLPENIAGMPKFDLIDIKKSDTKITMKYNGVSDIATMAKMLKEEFDSRPEGMRYVNFGMSLEQQVEHMIYMDKTTAMYKAWIQEFFTEYKRIGGKIDGLILDDEYSPIGAYYIHKAYRTKSTEKDDEGVTITIERKKTIYKDIVNDPRYATDVRPQLAERGFDFWEPGEYVKSNQSQIADEDKSEICTLSVDGSAEMDIWNSVMRNRFCIYINDACAPFMELYPEAIVSNYRFGGVNQWDENTYQNGGTAVGGNEMYAGNAANENFYLRRPFSNMRVTSSRYKTPATYNGAVYEDNPFNAFLMETNILKDTYSASDGIINAWIAGFNYQASTARPQNGVTYSPYYAETLYHIGMLNPQPFIGYVISPRDTDLNDDPYDYTDVMKNISQIMSELTRVAGFSDRKVIEIPRTWNSDFVLSGMYAGGRNIWRITPNTCEGTTLAEFKVEGTQDPTFSISGQTVTFPQGKIIKDKKISFTGTCGYWVETPKNVMPVITTDADRYAKNPAYAETFESYDEGTAFSKTTARHPDGWLIGAKNLTIKSHNGSKALEITGSVLLENMKIPANITAGDSYAKQQVWEVTVTVPSSGEMTVLACGDEESGIRISGGKAYYDGTTELASVTPGKSYIIRREFDFRNESAFTCTYSVLDTNGSVAGQKKDAAMQKVSLPAKNITFTSTDVDVAYIDNYRLYAAGVTAELRLYEADTGMRIEDASAARTEDTVYRLSWMNASGDYQVAKIYNNGKLLKTVQMPAGSDSFVTELVKGSSKITVTVEKSTPPMDNPSTETVKPGFEEYETRPTELIIYPHETEDWFATEEDTEYTEPTELTEPVQENAGLSGGTIALIAVGGALVLLAGGFVLCWFVIKPKWLEALKGKIGKKQDN